MDQLEMEQVVKLVPILFQTTVHVGSARYVPGDGAEEINMVHCSGRKMRVLSNGQYR